MPKIIYDFTDKLEPGVAKITYLTDDETCWLSIAISLKRLADLQQQQLERLDALSRGASS